jgi:hypothetical protein
LALGHRGVDFLSVARIVKDRPVRERVEAALGFRRDGERSTRRRVRAAEDGSGGFAHGGVVDGAMAVVGTPKVAQREKAAGGRRRRRRRARRRRARRWRRWRARRRRHGRRRGRRRGRRW